MSSEMLKRLDELRKNLDKNSKRTPDYHINSNKDYQIHKKVTVNDQRDQPRKSKNDTPKNIATDKVKNQVKDLFNYGFTLSSRTKILVSADKYQKYDTFKFTDLFQVAAVLSEYSKGADIIVFMVDVRNDSIIWSNNYGSDEIRVYTQ